MHSIVRCILPVVALVALLAGCEKEEETPLAPLPPIEGAIHARYSVGDSTTVVFAMGNLQYHAVQRKWRFAANQYDIVGYGNNGIDTTYNGWIDLFGWGTSGYDGKVPYMTDDTATHYGNGQADIAGTQYDWGEHNAISNGGNTAGTWRTLTAAEWRHLLNYRESASVKRGMATIETKGGEVTGLVLLPDEWNIPGGCSFQPGNGGGFATNVYSVTQWNQMQDSGAVFLPAAGYRDRMTTSFVGSYGAYWTGSYQTEQTAYECSFQSTRLEITTASRSNGQSVRLVQER